MAEVAVEEVTTRIKKKLLEEAIEQLVMHLIKVPEVAAVAEEEEVETNKTARNQNLINKRKIKIQPKTNSIVCLELQLLRILKSRRSTLLS